MKSKDFLNDEWSKKYKRSINCSSPKGFSQRAHCAGRKKNESVELDEIDRRGFLKGLGAAALAGAGGAAMAGDTERDIGPLPIMATIKVQMPDGTVKTKKIDLGHEYDYRMDDAKKEIEQILNRKGVKNYTIHLDRYRDNEAYLDREQMKPQSKTNNDYMDRKPYQPKGGTGSYVDNAPLAPKAGSKHNYMDPANYESVQETDNDDDLFAKPLADRIRDRMAELEDQDFMEPEDMIDQVADEFNLEVEQVYDLLDDDLNEGGPFSYGAKKPRKGSVADLAAKKRKEQEKDKQPAEPKDHMVGVARVVKEYGDTAKGQKMLTKVHKRAVDRTIRADDKNKLEPDYTKRDLTTVRKNQATADRAWDRMSDLDVYEADAELAEPPERPRKQQTATKQKSKLDPNMFAPKQDQPLAKTDPLDDLKRKAGVGSDKPQVTIKKASQADTLSKTAGIGSDDMADMLSRMRNIEVDRDLEAYPEPEPPETLPSVEVNTANLPAVAGQALQAAGVQNPDFHQVANLPGNMADQIRQLGKSLFGSLTMTPTKRIHVVANLGGQGPNSTAEVNAVAGFLKEHGKDLGPGDIDFERVMPGYKAQTHMFSAAGIRWMLVKDFAGSYIYCWPEEDSHDAQDAIGMNKDVKQLR